MFPPTEPVVIAGRNSGHYLWALFTNHWTRPYSAVRFDYHTLPFLSIHGYNNVEDQWAIFRR